MARSALVGRAIRMRFPLAVQRLNGFDEKMMRGGFMGNLATAKSDDMQGKPEDGASGGTAQSGWQVSQVERLIEMPKRDIQRSCYPDRERGGADILRPVNGSWGRREYSAEDIAWLYLVKLQHDKGYSLPEIARRFEADGEPHALRRYYEILCERSVERLETAQIEFERARILRLVVDAPDYVSAHDALEGYLREVLGDALVESLCKAVVLHRSGAVTGMSGVAALDHPGIDLAIDLWAGAGTFDSLCS